MTDSDNSLQPGSTFGKHRIVRLLGRGGMGEVYEVEHELTGDRHALKLLSADVLEVPGALGRFEREAKVMARLQHSGIVRVDLAGEDEGRHWLRMELMSGREVQGKLVITLEEYVEAKGGRLAETEVKKLTEEILEALGHAHGEGLVHRDLKPANILLDGERLKIADFGLVHAAGSEWMDTQVRSMLINPNEEDTLIDDGSSTGWRSRAIMGTYSFMSPEQKKGQPTDARSDLYAVGLMSFRILTGVETPSFKLPTSIIKEIDPGWDCWVEHCMEENPSDRFPTAEEMKTALSFEAARIAPAQTAKPESHTFSESEEEADPDPDVRVSLGPTGTMHFLRFWILFAIVFLFDLATKTWVVENWKELKYDPIVVLDMIEGEPAFLEFTYVTNPGAAWSMFSDYPEVLTALAGIALFAIFLFRKSLELERKPIQIIFGLICGGIVGNLTDRIFREPAAVVDFIDVYLPLVDYDYPIFNIADSGIFVGAFAYLFLSFFDSRKEEDEAVGN